MKNLNETAGAFIVKESRGLNFFVGTFLLLMAVSILIYSRPLGDSSIFLVIFSLPASLIFIIKGAIAKKIFEINDQGIYYYGELITEWKYYINSYFKEEENDSTEYPSTNFFLYIEFTRPGKEHVVISKILLSNTQNKSEEAIVNTIKYYSTNKTS
ncbi:MAG: hypothetical protein QM737_00855 [Ferruginibacter sp.]